MTQKDKELLLKDICTRLPYMPKIRIIYQQQGVKGTEEGNVSCDFIEKIVNDLRNGVITDMQIYLRPMSNMTEEEKNDYLNTFKKSIIGKDEEDGRVWTVDSIDYLNANHFDYRGLIEKGLAIEVTEENNPYKD